MGCDMFIKIDGIHGESRDATHTDEIDVTEWSWNVSQQSSMHSGSGGGAVKATVADLGFTHTMDRASPNLASYCFTGKHIPKAVLTMRKAGSVPHEYARITLYDVVITYVGPVANEIGCQEHVCLSFARMKNEYIVQNSIGGTGGTVTALIDVKVNKSN
ncbi:Hcp family type VI secretion system effector [Paraburkholderia sabiae]|jgi:type VI secretion system secreted protein Hcp|uniref:Type VI secretion system tube protein Hcp n=1 Tax=Paraburkholderia sabiae TaxID=273251 RepID=A0ABU9QKU3_9BURK|nr:type VI secretion system tube protein Hcp [Paraburkholderia sabiae]WJZ71981.1 type VI secretion system tube protein Hcp [Paraburkholderia sabiae]CAD6517392.1 Protein hcp1 [Paraburkholderia sabiae]